MKNKRIAEFMGEPYYYADEERYYYADDEGMEFHTSWDWLMPVVQKCYDLEDEEMNNSGATADISMYLTDVDIQGVYSAVSEFIKQYTIIQNQDDE
tara:strand:+ start:680 stop:967 length:288 start_codon:yes stop_codon:yes gene_type:complete